MNTIPFGWHLMLSEKKFCFHYQVSVIQGISLNLVSKIQILTITCPILDMAHIIKPKQNV
uniref:Uncharacterized protein n=1 Tax=Arundo donax TaxID=35708 RepID=A0A0A8YIH3_ARUDO